MFRTGYVRGRCWARLAGVLLVVSASVQAASVSLPLERKNYVIGEKVPLAIAEASNKVTVDLVDERGVTWTLYSGPAQPLVWDTTLVAPGIYRLSAGDSNAAVTLLLRSPLRESPMGLVDESGLSSKVDYRPGLADSGMTAVFWPSYLERGSRNEPGLDDYMPTATMAYINPTTRPSSFYPPRVGQNELQGFRQRLAFYAQANARYPTFGGFWYDWDGASLFEMKGLTRWFGLGKRLDAFRKWSDRRDQAVYDEFKRRTGMDGVKPDEFFRYCLSRGRAEFGPNLDYYMFKMSREMAPHIQPLPASEIAGFEKRLDAWNRYLMGVWAEAYHGHQAFLRDVVPGLRNTSSVNIDHGPVRLGHWDPGYSAELDFRYMSTWNDQMGSPDYSYQWLFTAAVLAIGRQPGQPIWLSSALAGTHGLSSFPGKFQRMAGHGLAYGQTGLGLACEGFSSLYGMTQQGYPSITNNPSLWQDFIAGRDFMQRFAALGEQCQPLRKVAVLYSQVQMGRQEISQGLASAQFAAFTTLARLGYQPQFITEDLITAGQLQGYGGLVIVNQSEPLPEAVGANLAAFMGAGGKLYLDRSSTIKVTGALPLDVALPYAQLGAPHNWTVMNSSGETSDQFQERRTQELMPKFYAALGDALRTPLMSAQGAGARASTFGMAGGRDATYVIAVNDYSYKTHADWVQFAETLQPNGAVTGAMYDLTVERALGPVAPVSCVFTDLTARVYGLLARPVDAIDLAATQKIKGGEALRLRVRFLDAAHQPLQAAIPFALALQQPDGKPALNLYRSTDVTGSFGLSWAVPANAPAGEWKLLVRSQLDGRTASLPVTVKAGGKLAAAPIADQTIVRGREQIEELLTGKTSFVLPLFDGPALAERRAVAEQVKTTLARRGVSVEVREHPAMTTYTVGYDPSPAELAENARVMRGEAIGSAVNDIEGYMAHYERVMSGYVFGKPVILLDLAGEPMQPPAVQDDPKKAKAKPALPLPANPMSAKLDELGLLWPKVTAAFPGPGRATIQIVKSAFAYGADALVIQAADAAGLKTVANAFADLPADWVGTGVARAREQLLEQFGIGVTNLPSVDASGLTAKGLSTGRDPQPLAIRFGPAHPPTPEQVASEAAVAKPVEKSGLPIPGPIQPNQFKAFYLIDSNLVATILPLPGDCRFFDALGCRVEVAQAGDYKVSIKGVFRYYDRAPKGQGGWETVMAVYNAAPRKREPMSFEVFVDGKSVGRVGELTTAEQEVELYQGGGEMVKEELVTQITGQVTLPAGTHELRLEQHYMQDGSIKAVEVVKPQ